MRILLEDISSGALVAGERLPRESDLVAQFGVSRGVVRECLRGLEERGMITVRQGSGARVNSASAWNVLDPDVLAAMLNGDADVTALFELLECRRVNEVEAAGLASQRATGTHLTRLSDALARMVASAERGQRSQSAEELFHASDIEFHQAVFEACGNRALLRMVQPIQTALFNARRPLGQPEQRFDRAITEHKAILSAIASRDAAAARAAMRVHLETVDSDLRDYASTQRTGLADGGGQDGPDAQP